MTYEDMVSQLKKPGSDILSSWTEVEASKAHMLTGVFDEHLEIMEALYALEGTETEPEATVELAKELGDLMFYLVGLAQDYGIAEQTLKYPLPPVGKDSLEAVIALTTMVKRNLYYNKPLDDLELAVAVRKVIAHVEQLAVMTGRSLENILDMNREKLLGHRYKAGAYSDDQANDRKDEEIS